MAPHKFMPDGSGGCSVAGCDAGPGDPVHKMADKDADGEIDAETLVLDQLEVGWLLAHRARLSEPERDSYDEFVARIPQCTDLELDQLGLVVDAEKPPPNKAPYKIQKRDGDWVVVNNGGEVKAKFGKDRAKALKYLRALYVNVPGAAKKAEKKDFTGKQKRAS